LSGGDILLMASDDPGTSHELGTGKIHLALGGSDEEKLRRIFDKLSAGGKVGVPLAKQMWGDIYGDLRDKYDIQWMINISAK
jgi:PhnB protein